MMYLDLWLKRENARDARTFCKQKKQALAVCRWAYELLFPVSVLWLVVFSSLPLKFGGMVKHIKKKKAAENHDNFAMNAGNT
jgi:hypothetical protein